MHQKEYSITEEDCVMKKFLLITAIVFVVILLGGKSKSTVSFQLEKSIFIFSDPSAPYNCWRDKAHPQLTLGPKWLKTHFQAISKNTHL